MVEKSFQPDENNRSSYQLRRIVEYGAVGLGIDEMVETIWIRKQFAVIRLES